MPRGRPPAPRFIVNINEVLTASQIIQENYTITLLAQSMPNTWEAIQWCARLINLLLINLPFIFYYYSRIRLIGHRLIRQFA